MPRKPAKGQQKRTKVVGQLDKEASQTRDYCVAKNATDRAARPDPSPRKERLLRMTIKLTYYPGDRGALRGAVRGGKRIDRGILAVTFAVRLNPMIG